MKLFVKLCFFLLIPINSWCQESGKTIEVTYFKAYKNFRNTTNTAPKTLKNIEYKLICNKNEARFELIPSMEIDGEQVNRRFISRGGGDGVYYKNISENLKLHQTESPFDNKEYIIKMPFNEHDWVITKEKKTISGYLCYKAYTEYEYENKRFGYIGKDTMVKVKIVVWFTPEINYAFGPAGFDGLPGLVLEKYSSSFYIIASKISFKDSGESISILKPEDGIEITNDEYNQNSDNAIKKLFKD